MPSTDISTAATRGITPGLERYERNLKAYGPVAAGALGLVDAAGAGAADTASSFAACLAQAQDAAGEVGQAVAAAVQAAAVQSQGAVTAGAAALGDGVTALADGAQSLLADLGVLAALSTAAAGTPMQTGAA